MMRKLVSSKLAFMLIAAIFMLSFTGTAVSQEAKGKEVKEVAGTISLIRPDIGKVGVVEKEPGRAVALLTAGSDVDLKDFSVGDQVVVKYTPDMVIRSITKYGE